MDGVLITDETGKLFPYSRNLIDIAGFLSGDSDSISQAQLLLQSEYMRWMALGETDYKPTRLSQTLLNSFNNKSEALYTTGLVGLALLGQLSLRQTASIKLAAKQVETFAAERDTLPFEMYDYSRRDFVVSPKNVASSESAIRRAIRPFKSVIHICTARLIAYDTITPNTSFEQNVEADKCYIATVAAFQSIFQKFDKVERDKRSQPFRIFPILWSTGFQFESEPLYPSTELMETLMKVTDVDT